MRKIALLLALLSCAQAQRHPAIAIGIVGAVVGGLACEMDGPAHQSTCGIIMAAAGGGLGVITGIATLIADTNEPSVVDDEDMQMENGAVRVHSHTAPPPVPLDAGVVDSAPVPVPPPVVVDSGSPVDGAEVKAGSNQ